MLNLNTKEGASCLFSCVLWTTEVQVPLLSIGVTATQVLTCPPVLRRHYGGMMQDGLRGGGGLTRIRTPTLA